MTATQLAHIEALFLNASPQELSELLDCAITGYALYALRDAESSGPHTEIADQVYHMKLLSETFKQIAESGYKQRV
jgi:hypothetical protein